MSRAAYMREYRARKRLSPQLKAISETFETSGIIARSADPIAAMANLLGEAQARVRDLEIEVARLKRVLATRPAPMLPGGFNTRPFTPVPKTTSKHR